MRDPKPHVFRALPLLLTLGAAVSAEAQAKPTTSARAADGIPIEEFDLEHAIVSESGGLTADQVAQTAVARSPQVQSAEASARSAEFDTDTAWANFLPRLNLFAQYKHISYVNNNLSIVDPDAAARFGAAVAAIPNNDPSKPAFAALGDMFLGSGGSSFTSPQDSYSTGATLQVPVSDILLRVLPAYEGSKGFAEARKLQAEATSETVQLQAREAFYAYADIVARRALADQAVKQAEAVAAQTKLFVDAGTKAPVELMTATAALERARGELAVADGRVAYARAMLATLMGVGQDKVQNIGEPVTQLPEAPTQNIDDLTRRALEERTELRALRKAVGANDKLVASEDHAKWPSLVLEGNTLYANPNPRYIPPQKEFHNTWDVSVTLSWTPNQVITAKSRSAKADADLAKARADLIAMEDQVRIEVVDSYENFKAAVAAARAAESGVKAAEEAYRVRLATYKVGAGVLIELTDAQQKLNDARLAFVAQAIQARRALAQLERRAALD